MGYRLVNISELNTFDYSKCTISGVQVCNKDNVRKGVDNFVVEGDEINDFTLEEIKPLLKAYEFNSLAKNIIIESIFIDYNNITSSSTVYDANTPFAKILTEVDFIAEFDIYKIVFENLYSIDIDTITASFEGQPSLTFNATDTYFCSNLDLDLFNELIIIFNSLKQNIISKICM